jgi:hypothetical protein
VGKNGRMRNDHLSPSSAEDNNAWRFTSISPIHFHGLIFGYRYNNLRLFVFRKLHLQELNRKLYFNGFRLILV